jgi:hypothetical protein
VRVEVEVRRVAEQQVAAEGEPEAAVGERQLRQAGGEVAAAVGGVAVANSSAASSKARVTARGEPR